MSVLIAIQRDIVKAHGANAAIVDQQVRWVIEYGIAAKTAHRTGWFTGTSDELADLSGLSSDQCRRAMARLLEAGRMEKQKFEASRGNHTMSYRPVDPSDLGSGDSAGSGSGKSAGSGSGGNAGSTSLSDTEEKTSPTPPEEGAQPELFACKDRGVTTRAERLHKSKGEAAAVSAVLDTLWPRYPTDGKKNARGSKQAARRAVGKALKAQVTTGELSDALDHYSAARQAYFDSWGRSAPLMNASTFFNGKWQLWDHPWDSDELAYWPAPPGREWAKPKRRSVDELLAAGGES